MILKNKWAKAALVVSTWTTFHGLATNRVFPSPISLGDCTELDLTKLRAQINLRIAQGELTEEAGADIEKALQRLDFKPGGRFDATQERGVDNPQEDYNNISDIAWDRFGKIQTVDDLAKAVNKDYHADANKSSYLKTLWWLKTLGTVGIVPLIHGIRSHQATGMGNFSVAEEMNNYRVYTHGYQMLGLHSKWHKKDEVFDKEEAADKPIEESCIRKITPNHTLLRVPKGFIGVAIISRSTVDATDNTRARANDQDPVLFSQGKYLLKETDYHSISLAKIDSAQDKIALGNVATILNIKPHQYGGAKRRGGQAGNKFVTWGPGKPIILDNKEWDDSFVIDIKNGINKMETRNTIYAQFVLVKEGSLVSVTTRSGQHGLITEPGLYELLSDKFILEATAYTSYGEKLNNANEPNGANRAAEASRTGNLDYTSNIDVGEFQVRTVAQDEMGIVQAVQGDGDFHLLLPGKYYLHKSRWINPRIQKLDRPEVKLGPWTFLTLTQDMAACAIDNINCRRVVFNEENGFKAGQKLQLHAKQFPHITQIPLNSTELFEFGGEYRITIPAGTYGMFEIENTIEAKDPGKVGVPVATSRFLHTLPSRPKILEMNDFTFKTANDMELVLNANITIHVISKDDAVRVSSYIRANSAPGVASLSHEDHIDHDAKNETEALARVRQRRALDQQRVNSGFTFKAIEDMIIKLTREKLMEKLKGYKHNELIVVAGEQGNAKNIAEAIATVENEALKELASYVHETMGVTITLINILGGIEFNSPEVKKQFEQRAQDREAVTTERIRQDRIRAAQQADAEEAIGKARKEQEILTIQERAKLERQAIALQIESQKQAQERDLAEKQKESELRRKDMELNQRLEETRRTAETEAAQIELLAKAKHADEMLRNEAGRNQPEQRFILEAMRAYNEGLEKIGQAAVTFPEFYQVLAGMGGKVGTTGSLDAAGAAGSMFYLNMMLKQIDALKDVVKSPAKEAQE